MNKKQESTEQLCRCLKGIAHPARMGVLEALRRGPASVGEIHGRLSGISQSGLSQHLAKMHGCGLLTSRREGSQVFYEVANARVLQFIDLLHELFCKQARGR